MHSSQYMNVVCAHTCPDTLVGVEEARRGAVVPPVALMDHCPSSAPPLLLLLAPTLPPKPVRPPDGPDLLSPLDLEGTHRQTWGNSLKAPKQSACVCASNLATACSPITLGDILMGCMHDKAGSG